MRILHVSPYFSDAWAYGGIPRLAGTLTRGLARLGHEVTVCTTDACEDSRRLSPGESRTREGVRVHVFPNVSNHLAYKLQLFLPFGLDRYLQQHAKDFDVAHLHACRNFPGAIAARRLVDAGIPYVLAPNGTAPIIERRKLAKRGFDLLLGSSVLKHASRVLAVSEVERQQLGELGVNPDAVRLVPNPVDLDEFAPAIERGQFRRRLGFTSEPIVMFLGKITPRKHVDVLVSAFSSLKRPDSWLVIAGNDMSPRQTARRLKARASCERTIFTGLLRGRERLEALADADVLVYPSAHEIFGLVPLEALLVGTPVIVADDSGCADVIKHVGGGLITSVGDSESLARAIAEILNDATGWRRRAADAAERVRACYGDTPVCASLDRVYGEMVARA
jgi:glycosyltransferase involved in cell wall biosynthesis